MYIRLSIVKASNSVSEDTVVVLTCGTKPLSTLIFFFTAVPFIFLIPWIIVRVLLENV